MSQDTHKLMLDHSQAKVKLYGSYLAKYLPIISQDKHTTNIHLYDLFSGEGIYEDGEKGSPLIAIDKINSCYTSNNNMPKLNITFNDIKPDVITKLKATIDSTQIPTNCTVRILNNNYLDLVGQVSSEIAAFKSEKAIVFLDPKGYKEISISDIKAFLTVGKSEVLVFLPIRDMYRFANMDSANISASHEPLYKFMDEIFPEGIPAFDSQPDYIHKIKEGLKNILPEYYVDTFMLEREPGQFFALFFFTGHIYGFEKMLETKWEIDTEQGRAFRYEQTGAMFSGTEVLNFPDRLKEFISVTKKSNLEVYKFILHEGFLPKHANELLRDWQNSNSVDVVDANGTPGRKGAFYLNYKECKSDPEKIFYSMKLTLF